MIELVDPSKQYDLKHPSGAVFSMRHWTYAMQEEVDRECFKIVGENPSWDANKERELKLFLAIVSWSGVVMDGADAPCTQENKLRLPVGVIFWLIKEIDERAGLRMSPAEKKILN